MGEDNLPEMQQTVDVETLTTNSAVHEDASNGPMAKRKREDVTEAQAPSSDKEGKETSEIGAESGQGAHGEDLAVPAMTTEVGEGVSEKTQATLTDAAGTKSKLVADDETMQIDLQGQAGGQADEKDVNEQSEAPAVPTEVGEAVAGNTKALLTEEDAGTQSKVVADDETTPMDVQGQAGGEAEEKDINEQSEAQKLVEEVDGEQEGEVKEEVSEKQSSGTENGNVMKHVAEETGEEKGKETEAVETERIEVEENGKEYKGTDPSSEETPEILEDNALDFSPPDTKRRKIEGRSVASTAARNEKIPGKPPCDPERLELLKNMTTVEDMKKLLADRGRSEVDYKVGDIIKVDDLMQTNYEYKLEAPMGKNFAEGFSPAFTPQQMLAFGIFEGKVINDCIFELPKEWYEEALEKGKLSPEGPDDSKNYFKVKSRLPSKQWRKRGWFPKEDPHGWFQWYCRYYLGRRLEPDDSHQISRWRQLRRHSGQIKKNCEPGDLSSRVKQRQTLLNWSHDCFM